MQKLVSVLGDVTSTTNQPTNTSTQGVPTLYAWLPTRQATKARGPIVLTRSVHKDVFVVGQSVASPTQGDKRQRNPNKGCHDVAWPSTTLHPLAWYLNLIIKAGTDYHVVKQWLPRGGVTLCTHKSDAGRERSGKPSVIAQKTGKRTWSRNSIVTMYLGSCESWQCDDNWQVGV